MENTWRFLIFFNVRYSVLSSPMTALAEEWHGDYWVPPFRQHSSLRARQLLDNKTVLVAGDSITRQFGATLALFLLRPFQHAKGIETEALLGAPAAVAHALC